MKIFLSALETNSCDGVVKRIGALKWNLCSYYYIRKCLGNYELILNHSENTMVDSGAHSFQYGIKVDWEKYTHEYAAFIKKYDCAKTLGYFEMDVDNIIGYDEVLKLRAVLEKASNKIIPVWHKNRGISEYEKMCREYTGRIIAITGFKNMDINDEQYPLFVKKAREHKCKVHCLGMTRKDVLDKVPFDFVDSSSWIMGAINGRLLGKKITREFSRNREEMFYYAYLAGMKMQNEYYAKWRKVHAD
jgi:hypothetical protein